MYLQLLRKNTPFFFKNVLFFRRTPVFRGDEEGDELISYCQHAANTCVAYPILHQHLVFFTLSAACDGTIFKAINSFALVADHRLSVARPLQRIVGAAILQDAVQALPVPGYIAIEVGCAEDETILCCIFQVVSCSQIAIVGIVFLGSREDDGFCMVLAIVEGGVDVPGAIYFFGTNHGVGAGSLECSFYAASRMVDGSEDKLAWVSGTDAVVCIAGCQQRGGKNEANTQKGEEHSFCCHTLHLIIYIHLIIYMIIYRCFFLH